MEMKEARMNALNLLCDECQRYKGRAKMACPLRSISDVYCKEYELLKNAIEENELLKRALLNILKAVFTAGKETKR